MRYFIKQIGEKDCALTCLKMLLAISIISSKEYVFSISFWGYKRNFFDL